MLRTSPLLLLSLLMLACSGEHPAVPLPPPETAIQVRHDTELQETHYTLTETGCSISWTIYRSELNLGVIRHRSDCGLPLAAQAPFIAKLLTEVMENDPGAAHFHTLSWGRLHPDNARDATMPLRLALAAKRAADWDVKHGAPAEGHINAWTAKLANDALIYEELRPVFRGAGLHIRIASVEKVLVLPAAELPFAPALQQQGVAPGDKLPYDCQTWFSVRPAAAAE